MQNLVWASKPSDDESRADAAQPGPVRIARSGVAPDAATHLQGSGATVTSASQSSRGTRSHRTTSLTSHPPAAVSGTTTSAPDPAMTVHYRVSGGFAGLHRALTITPEGGTVYEINGRVREGELEPSEVRQITQALDASGLFADGYSEPSPSQGRDLQQYQITYRRRTVEVYDSAIPGELRPAVRLLNSALREQSKPA